MALVMLLLLDLAPDVPAGEGLAEEHGDDGGDEARVLEDAKVLRGGLFGVCVLRSLPTPRAREERLVLVAADLRGPPLQLLVAAAGVHYHSLGLLGGA